VSFERYFLENVIFQASKLLMMMMWEKNFYFFFLPKILFFFLEERQLADEGRAFNERD
jgi:hypothetical protein